MIDILIDDFSGDSQFFHLYILLYFKKYKYCTSLGLFTLIQTIGVSFLENALIWVEICMMPLNEIPYQTKLHH